MANAAVAMPDECGEHSGPCSLVETRRRYDGPGGALLALGSILSLHEPLLGRLFRQRILDVSQCKRILDVGVGVGQCLKHLVKYTAPTCQITAIDFSAAMLKRAQTRVGSARPWFLQGDLRRLPFADEAFDCVVCGRVLEHLPEVQQGLAEIARVLEPGGRLFLLATEDTWAGTALGKAWHCRTFDRNHLRSLCERLPLQWQEELWLTPLHRVCGMGGIIACVQKNAVASLTVHTQNQPSEGGKGNECDCSSEYVNPASSMRHRNLRFGLGFRVVLGDEHAQAAQMTLAPGETTGGSDNRHRGADQWLFVVSGKGVATIGRTPIELREHALLLIPRGNTHEIRNTGRSPLRTLNFYIPPAYTPNGDERPAGKPQLHTPRRVQLVCPKFRDERMPPVVNRQRRETIQSEHSAGGLEATTERVIAECAAGSARVSRRTDRPAWRRRRCARPSMRLCKE